MASLDDFLGTGVAAPFRRGATDLATASGVDFVRDCVANVLSTTCASPLGDGELPWRQRFGSLLHRLRHRNNDETTAELARIYVGEALGAWVPQLRLRSVATEKERDSDGNPSILAIRLVYDLAASNRANAPIVVNGIKQTIRIAA